MIQDRETPNPQTPDMRGAASLLADAYRDLMALRDATTALERALDALREADGGPSVEAAIAKARASLRAIEPAVTMIGQVKAGKTTLVNAMVGWPNLLPADINPWTSVVTSLHLSPHLPVSGQRAAFRFFTDEEWDHLLTRGGRMGELASRAGADTELEKVRSQLEEMRAASRRRLGSRFEMLLGQTHDYGYIDAELIQRYVCLGDEGGGGDGAVSSGAAATQGRFADITRSADLYLGQPALPLPICLRDTPGVNDTFMVREQITVNAIRASRLCVVVLSAHQALSTVDMALIRLIANVPSREVIIFVNRIDELADPVRDVAAIRQSIRDTLRTHSVPDDAEILFGSAHWASHALAGDLNRLGRASADALVALAEHEASEGRCTGDAVAMVWSLSGVPALGRAIAMRMAEGEGAETLAAAAGMAGNIAQSIAAAHAVETRQIGSARVRPITAAAMVNRIDAAIAEIETRLAVQVDALARDHADRLEGARRAFVARATAALAGHLETEGRDTVWSYDPVGLRLLFRSGYQRFTARAAGAARAVHAEAAETMRALCLDGFQLPPETFRLDPPPVPEPPVPVMLGRTIALDIKGRWWSRWWQRRRSAEAQAEEFRALIDAEIAPMVEDLHRDHALTYATQLKTGLSAFLAAQKAALMDLAERSGEDLAVLRKRLARDAERKSAALERAQAILTDIETPARRSAAE